MALKSDVEVIIGGKVYTISGQESEEYIQKVASYLNGKFNEFAQVEGFRRANFENQNILMQLNIADDYFKEFARVDSLKEELASKEKELYDLKHDLVNAQMKLENMDKSTKILRDELNEKDKKIIRLETELKGLKKQ